MSWKLDHQSALAGASIPHFILFQQVGFEWREDEEIEIYSAEYWARMPDMSSISWTGSRLAIGPKILRRGTSATFYVTLPISSQFLRRVEDWRAGRGIDVRIDVTINLHFRPVRYAQLGLGAGQSPVIVRDLLEPQSDQVQVSLCANRDQWIGILKAIGWSDYLSFEVPVLALKRHEKLAKGLERIDKAQKALLDGHWDACVMECRKAIEASASTVSGDSDRKKKFEALVQEVLPKPHDKAKAATLSGLMVSLKELRDEAAHGGNLSAQVEREDAELALTVALAVFRYIGEALARQEQRA